MGSVLGIALMAVIGMYVWWFHYKLGLGLSPERSDWGTLGDYVGGLLNPFIGLNDRFRPKAVAQKGDIITLPSHGEFAYKNDLSY